MGETVKYLILPDKKVYRVETAKRITFSYLLKKLVLYTCCVMYSFKQVLMPWRSYWFKKDLYL